MNIKISILTILNLSKPYLLPTNSLRSELETRHAGRVGDTDFTEAVQQLETRGLIAHEVDGLSGDTKYRITGAGESQLRH